MFVGSTTSSVVACNFAVSSFQPKVTWPEHRPAGSARHSGITHDAGSQASEAPIEPSWGPEPQMAGAVKSEPGALLPKEASCGESTSLEANFYKNSTRS